MGHSVGSLERALFFSFFSPRDGSSDPCHEQDLALTRGDRDANPLVECVF